jgi:hypothetical protein
LVKVLTLYYTGQGLFQDRGGAGRGIGIDETDAVIGRSGMLGLVMMCCILRFWNGEGTRLGLGTCREETGKVLGTLYF